VLEFGVEVGILKAGATVVIMPLIVGGFECPAMIAEIQEAGVATMNRFARSMHTSRAGTMPARIHYF
jgi:hypothetical protein